MRRIISSWKDLTNIFKAETCGYIFFHVLKNFLIQSLYARFQRETPLIHILSWIKKMFFSSDDDLSC